MDTIGHIWVCRTGISGQFEKLFLDKSLICLTRENLDINLSKSEKDVVIEKIRNGDSLLAKQTISNIWSQINIFANKMGIGDLVIIPRKASRLISIAVIIGEYTFEPTKAFPLNHSRTIRVLKSEVDTVSFPQEIKYSLGAFRTIFGVRQVDELIDLLEKEGYLNEV